MGKGIRSHMPLSGRISRCFRHYTWRISSAWPFVFFTLIPLRISFMIFNRLSLYFIFCTCQEKDKTKMIFCEVRSGFAAHGRPLWKMWPPFYQNLRCPVMAFISLQLQLVSSEPERRHACFYPSSCSLA